MRSESKRNIFIQKLKNTRFKMLIILVNSYHNSVKDALAGDFTLLNRPSETSRIWSVW